MAQKKQSTDTAAVKDLLLWARKERIVLQQVQIGTVAVVVTMDHRLAHHDGDERRPTEVARQGIIEQYGGALFNPPVTPSEDVAEPTVEDDDD